MTRTADKSFVLDVREGSAREPQPHQLVALKINESAQDCVISMRSHRDAVDVFTPRGLIQGEISSEEKLELLFNMFDKDGDGVIGFKDLMTMLEVGPEVTLTHCL